MAIFILNEAVDVVGDGTDLAGDLVNARSNRIFDVVQVQVGAVKLHSTATS